ncbi:hypothetical protein HYW20_01450 [Candidatus Woesearchaeota archaeon]|nr:hypothetical protein [Candidatus Woesearchaeota archaeon]
MKKADTMLTFFFWTVLALVIFIPTTLWASQFFKLGNKTLDTYYKLVENVVSIKDGETLSLPFYMEKNTFIVGFAKVSDKFENHAYKYVAIEPTEIAYIFNRPSKCSNGKACICACVDMSFDQKTKPYSVACNKEPICANFDSIDFVSEKIIKKDADKPLVSWKGGFIISKGTPIEGLNLLQPASTTVYVERYTNLVDVCFSRPCITTETIQKTTQIQ